MKYSYKKWYYLAFFWAFDLTIGNLVKLFVGKGEMKDPERIVVFNPGHIGDAVLASSFCRALKECFHYAEITVVCGSWAREAVELCDFVDSTIVYDGGVVRRERKSRMMRGELVSELKRRKFDLGFALKGDPTAILAMFRASIPFRAGFADGGLKGFLHYSVWPDSNIHQVENYLKLLRPFKCGGGEMLPELNIAPQNEERAEALLRGADLENSEFIVMHPGAGYPSKLWPEEYWVELCKRILKETDYSIVILGGKDVEGISKTLTKLDQTRVRRIESGIGETLGILSKADAFIGLDSAVGHLASVVEDLPIVTIFSLANVPERWKPVGENARVLTAEGLPCKYCEKRECAEGNLCMRQIKPEKVFDKLSSLIDF